MIGGGLRGAVLVLVTFTVANERASHAFKKFETVDGQSKVNFSKFLEVYTTFFFLVDTK